MSGAFSILFNRLINILNYIVFFRFIYSITSNRSLTPKSRYIIIYIRLIIKDSSSFKLLVRMVFTILLPTLLALLILKRKGDLNNQ